MLHDAERKRSPAARMVSRTDRPLKLQIFSLGRTFDYPLLARNQSKVGHVQEKAMFHHSNDRVDLGRDIVRVFDKNAGTVEN
jgi:hypothetical protein